MLADVSRETFIFTKNQNVSRETLKSASDAVIISAERKMQDGEHNGKNNRNSKSEGRGGKNDHLRESVRRTA